MQWRKIKIHPPCPKKRYRPPVLILWNRSEDRKDNAREATFKIGIPRGSQQSKPMSVEARRAWERLSRVTAFKVNVAVWLESFIPAFGAGATVGAMLVLAARFFNW